MSPRRTLGVVVPVGGHRIDEGLIVSILTARGDEGRLAVCLADELGGVHIGNPDLNQALLPQSLAILPHSVASGCHATVLHVTVGTPAIVRRPLTRDDVAPRPAFVTERRRLRNRAPTAAGWGERREWAAVVDHAIHPHPHDGCINDVPIATVRVTFTVTVSGLA
jgi:hypothetical protein